MNGPEFWRGGGYTYRETIRQVSWKVRARRCPAHELPPRDTERMTSRTLTETSQQNVLESGYTDWETNRHWQTFGEWMTSETMAQVQVPTPRNVHACMQGPAGMQNAGAFWWFNISTRIFLVKQDLLLSILSERHLLWDYSYDDVVERRN